MDIVAELDLSHVAPFVGALSGKYYVDAEAVSNAVRQASSFNLIHLDMLMKVDVFIACKGTLDTEALERRRVDALEDEKQRRDVYVATAEDVVLHKRRALRMDLTELLQRALREVGLE